MASVTLTDRFNDHYYSDSLPSEVRPSPVVLRVEPSNVVPGGVFLGSIDLTGSSYHISNDDAIALRDALTKAIDDAKPGRFARIEVEIPASMEAEFREDLGAEFKGRVVE